MFSKVSLFAGLNNLYDISLNPNFASICGFTERELDSVFEEELEGLDRETIRQWYNGYNWRGEDRVYNPVGILNLFASREIQPYWYQTATPTYLLSLIVNQRVNPLTLDNLEIDESLLAKFDIDMIDLRALMFQSGYLTIAEAKVETGVVRYQLEFPNLEVRSCFNRDLLIHLNQDEQVTSDSANFLLQRLASNDFEAFFNRLRAYLAQVPHQWYDAGNLGQYEPHYAAMLLLTLRAVSADVRVEDASSRGRADMVLFHANQVYVFEFKHVKTTEDSAAALTSALDQMRERGYAEKYLERGERIHLIGIVFDEEGRYVSADRVERFERS